LGLKLAPVHDERFRDKSLRFPNNAPGHGDGVGGNDDGERMTDERPCPESDDDWVQGKRSRFLAICARKCSS
jgi:hypothetical protein